ncbi:MAG: phosphatidylglycerophosphatase A [Glaciecola sp.]|jgi:phosphatidylglycerophosphatase A|uniref:phosphatidylglycerophosphatase A family protein n=1 Tax=Congregibacter sp. TaxID=2744308 RepID=UPI0039E24E1F
MNAHPRPTLTDPIQLLAFGFGSGLSPKAPGTVGTIAALPFYWFMASQPLWIYSLIVIVAALLGIWICGRASTALGVHDHPGIVWDEFVGIWIALWAVPFEPLWILAGFLVFRVFDIAKPWPISWLDRHVTGGFGIMIDDVLAGVLACFTLHLALSFGGNL